jgi:hypothetical protein
VQRARQVDPERMHRVRLGRLSVDNQEEQRFEEFVERSLTPRVTRGRQQQRRLTPVYRGRATQHLVRRQLSREVDGDLTQNVAVDEPDIRLPARIMLLVRYR